MFRFTCLFAASAQEIDLTITPTNDAFNVAFKAPTDATWCAIGSQDDASLQMKGIKGHIFKLDDEVTPQSATRFIGGKTAGTPTYVDNEAEFDSHFTALGYRNDESREITATMKKDAINVAYACGSGETFPPTDRHSKRGLKPLKQDTTGGEPETNIEAEPGQESGQDGGQDGADAGAGGADGDSAGAVSVMMIFATLL